MKAIPLLLLAALCACAGAPRPDYIDGRRDPFAAAGNYAPEEGFAAPEDSDDAEREDAKQIRAIEARIARGKLPKIQFEFDKAGITPESTPTLDLIADLIRSDEHLKLMVNAYCDDIGSDAYNLDLARRRVMAVTSYLASKGVPPPSMRFHVYGASRPVADNATEAGRGKNRRVEFYIMTRSWKAVY